MKMVWNRGSNGDPSGEEVSVKAAEARDGRWVICGVEWGVKLVGDRSSKSGVVWSSIV